MTLEEKIEHAFAQRQKPAEVIDPNVWQFDSDVEEAAWFAGRDWHALAREDWQQHSSAIFFFSPEAFAYYLPSLLIITANYSDVWFSAADALLYYLDLSPSKEAWPENFSRRFLALRVEEAQVLGEWLLVMCEYPTYRGYGVSAFGPGDKFGRAFETLGLLQTEIEQKRIVS